ncbi:unnamed protein product, partial [Arabidopsis halleri]
KYEAKRIVRCSYSWEIWGNLSRRCNFQSARSRDSLLKQLQGFSSPKPLRKLLLLAWQASMYLIWKERN